mgnify:CR=1 FL=1
MMKLLKNEDAFTGLEAAIVLIAFIVVAAVFSYVMLGAGFFATGEAQKVVHAGSQQASSSLEIIGNVYGYAESATKLDYIVFTVGNTAGGTPIDISQMLVTYVCEKKSDVIGFKSGAAQYKDADGFDPKSVGSHLSAGEWTVIKTYNNVGEGDKLLESGEQFVLAIVLPSDARPGNNIPFSINLQPAVGAVYPIKKTVPANLDKVNILY